MKSRANPYNGFRSAARTATSFSHPACTSGCFRSERRDDGYPTCAKWLKNAGNEPAGSVCVCVCVVEFAASARTTNQIQEAGHRQRG